MKSDPFLHALLSKYSDAVTSPKLEDNGFPSPFAIYLIATNEALKEKERVSNKRFISIQKDNKELIHLVKELDLENLHNFFETVLILNGITWRLVNRNKNKSTCVDNSIFKTLLEECTNFWDKIQNNIVSNDLLKLTWATQLLLVSFCNILRAYKDEQNNFNEDYQKLMSIAAHADHTQKLHSNGYKAFLEGDSSSEFFMISGAMRYTSLFYEQIDEDKRNKISFLLSDEMIKNYSIWLAEEKHPRFFWLTYRFLSFTNFFEQESKISDKLSDQIMKNMTMITPRERKNYFLSYDNMTDLSVKDILKTFSKMEHGDRFLKCFDELASQ
jgi:hypothetical protein